MRSPASALRAAPALLLAAAGCWVPIERGQQMEARIGRLEVQSREQAQELEEQVKAKLVQVDRKLKEVQSRLDELNLAAHRSGADLGVAVGDVRDQLARLRGDLEVQQHQLGELQRQLADASKQTDTRLAALKGTGALDEALAREKLAALSKPDDPAAVYALAAEQDGAGEAGVAREIYLQYLKRWPRGDRADEAGFRAGELLSQARRWREAVVVYGKVAEDHPRSPRAPDALLGVAEGLVKLDRREDARAILEQVIAQHPRTAAATRARARLAELFPARAKRGAAGKR